MEQNPFFTVFGWAVGGLAFAFIFIQILNAWLIDRIISAVQALLLVLVIFLLFAAMWKTQGDQVMVLYVALMVGAAGATHLIHVEYDRRLLRRLREESMAQYRAVIARDPKNAAAHAYLAETLAEIGQYDAAIEELETAITLEPSRQREHHKLRQVMAARDRSRGQAPVQCLECRAENPRGSRTCVKCGASLNTSFFVWLFTPANLIDVLFRCAIPMLAVIILVAVLFCLPLPIVGCVICAGVLVGAFFLLRWIGRDHS